MIGDATMVGRYGEDIERLLEELEKTVGPATWPRVEALVAALVSLYGAGLERILAHARAAAATREGLEVLLAGDDLLASLLLVHGLHPIRLERRVEVGLRRLRAELPMAARLELVAVDGGVVRLRSVGVEGPPPAMHLVARAIEREAPEITGVEVDGLSAPPPHGQALVPADRLRRGGRS